MSVTHDIPWYNNQVGSAIFGPQRFGGADSRGVSRGEVAGDLGDRDEEDGWGDQDRNTVGLHAGEARHDESGYAEGAEQTDGGADEREPRTGREDEAGDVSGLGTQREADAEFAGALGHGAGDDAVDAQGGQTEPEGGQRGKHDAEDALLVVSPGDRGFGGLEFAHRQVLVERHHGGANTIHEDGRRDSSSAHGDFVEGPGFLAHRLVELVGRHRAPIGVDRLDVTDAAADLSPLDGFATGLGNAPTERTLAGKETTGHGLVDDEDFRGGEGVVCGDGACGGRTGGDGCEVWAREG